MDEMESMRETLLNQFGASLEMLENAIIMCPEEQWDNESNIWYISYHCLFWTDYYLTAEPNTFAPPSPFTLSEFNPDGSKPNRTYSKTEILQYVDHCRKKSMVLISELTQEKLNNRWVNEYKNYSILEILLYNMRHVQHHGAQLNLLLRQSINNSPSWVGRSTSTQR